MLYCSPRTKSDLTTKKFTGNPISLVLFQMLTYQGTILKNITNSVSDFTALKALDVRIQPPKAPTIREVIWKPPIQN